MGLMPYPPIIAIAHLVYPSCSLTITALNDTLASKGLKHFEPEAGHSWNSILSMRTRLLLEHYLSDTGHLSNETVVNDYAWKNDDVNTDDDDDDDGDGGGGGGGGGGCGDDYRLYILH
ncbi:hypothetical protein DPMN_002059 [Dreissena polymorpha]|uniref:Uncharacterized protein n=1 Tax=Dreissena polymorpha TaxID=45954 RepID=A0A9D4RTI8_DREPO|nr:hypothetical protein DPMN_002059 [Dreissena polymorpha]